MQHERKPCGTVFVMNIVWGYKTIIIWRSQNQEKGSFQVRESAFASDLNWCTKAIIYSRISPEAPLTRSNSTWNVCSWINCFGTQQDSIDECSCFWWTISSGTDIAALTYHQFPAFHQFNNYTPPLFVHRWMVTVIFVMKVHMYMHNINVILAVFTSTLYTSCYMSALPPHTIWFYYCLYLKFYILSSLLYRFSV